MTVPEAGRGVSPIRSPTTSTDREERHDAQIRRPVVAAERFAPAPSDRSREIAVTPDDVPGRRR